MSALVYPGVGQFIQKRWVAGAIYTFAFTATGGYFVFEFARIMIVYLSQMTFDAPAQPAPGFRGLLVGFLLALLAYAASLIDTYAAHTRALRALQAAHPSMHP